MVLDKARQDTPEKPKRSQPVVVSMSGPSVVEESLPLLKVSSLESDSRHAPQAVERFESIAPEPTIAREPEPENSGPAESK